MRSPCILFKVSSQNKFTVVSACFNVSDYIDEFIKSLVAQTVSFEETIFCVLVDDGSTDDTKEKIMTWKKRYPKNIEYVYQENNGQASARNEGLKYVKTKWVTFIDPDDFVSRNYFAEVDRIVATSNKRIAMVGTNIKMYQENSSTCSDTHALKYKFSKGTVIEKVSDISDDIQLSAASAFFDITRIHDIDLEFDSRVKPNFEDAHFIGFYLASDVNSYVAYIPEAIYFYRKRADANSTLDKAWTDSRKYFDVLEYGIVDLLRKNRDKKFVQVTALYDLYWYAKYLVNNPERLEFLSENDKIKFMKLLDEAFSYIDDETIMNFSKAGIWFYHKVGFLNCFKGKNPKKQTVYVEEFNPYKNQIKLRYFTGELKLEELVADGVDVFPVTTKTVKDDFLSRTFTLQRILWVEVPSKCKVFKCRINREDAVISINGKRVPSLTAADLTSLKAKYPRKPDDAPWIFMDREIQADDNAEHLYRYVSKVYPEKEIYFVLMKSSHDWNRLKNEGFNLLEYGSAHHEDILKKSSKIISSHIDGYTINYFKDPKFNDQQVVFLQHGVTKDDLSRWLNKKRRIDLFVTASLPEYNSIISDESRYRYATNSVKLLGFPRHDKLLEYSPKIKRVIVMPTWRNNLMGHQISGNLRDKNPNFMNSQYAQSWKSFLTSKRLKDLAIKYDYEIVFYPHSNIQAYLIDFNLPEYVHVRRHVDGSIQDVFKTSDVLITDYSSVAFEMALLKKFVLYYQFDEKTFFSGSHTYQKGYFDYRRDGFGPVVVTEDELLNELESYLANNSQVPEVYKYRTDRVFKFRDGNNCRRVLEAILDLDKPDPKGFVEAASARKYLFNTIKYGTLPLFVERYNNCKDWIEDEFLYAFYKVASLIVEGRFCESWVAISEIKFIELLVDLRVPFIKLFLNLALINERYTECLQIIDGCKDFLTDAKYYKIICDILTSNNKLTIHSILDYPFGISYDELDRYLDANGFSMSVAFLGSLIALSKKDWRLESRYRQLIRNNSGTNVFWRILAAFRSILDERSDAIPNALENLRLAFHTFNDMPSYVFDLYCLCKKRDIVEIYKNTPETKKEIALPYLSDYLVESKKWNILVEVYEEALSAGIFSETNKLAFALFKCGEFKRAHDMYATVNIECGLDDLEAKLFLFILFKNYKQSLSVIDEILKRYPDLSFKYLELIVHLRCLNGD